MKTNNPFCRTHKQVSIFLTAGFPELESLNSQLELLEVAGVDFVEVGIPFSDPLADGPVIQASSRRALENGMRLETLFQQLARRTVHLPIVLMGYLNPVLNFGLERFLTACESVGVDTVILPDLSPDIYQKFYQTTFEKSAVRNVFLITPQTPPARVATIAELCQDRFVYLVSGNATTGGQMQLQLPENTLVGIRKACRSTPLFIGFGIQHHEDVARVHQLADGAIIGSAFLRAVEANEAENFLKKLHLQKKNTGFEKNNSEKIAHNTPI